MLSKNLLALVLLFFSTTLFADNGRVVHLAWTENTDGSIQNADNNNFGLYFIEQRNQFLNYKDPNNPLFKIRFTKLGIDWTYLHGLALLATILFQVFTFKRINKRMAQSRFFGRWSYRILKLFLWGGVVGGNIGAIYAIDYYNTQIYFRYHLLSDFNNASLDQLNTGRKDRTFFLPKESALIRFQLYRKSNHKWHTQRALPVLHFQRSENGELFYKYDKRSFKAHRDAGHMKATNQLLLIDQKNKNGTDTTLIFQIDQRQIVPYELKTDEAERILLFVNGYRPISTDQDPEKALQAINNKGLEHPRSKNLIHTTDIFGYWQQEKFIFEFQQRLNPSKTLYADGHHSVKTSNHGSLIQFASSAALYPKPCKGEHHCARTQITNQQNIRTYSLLATKPNYEGFLQRYLSGVKAGRNLLQQLSKNGNNTKNDTLYAVSHSMGHAYFMGMALVLKRKIQFAAYFAFAPENPKGKRFAAYLWPKVYQYGTKLYGPQRHAPCQQDGVAPQWRMSGIAPSNQIGFPKSLTERLGYFNAHYIGFYTWVFDIPKSKPGSIVLGP